MLIIKNFLSLESCDQIVSTLNKIGWLGQTNEDPEYNRLAKKHLQLNASASMSLGAGSDLTASAPIITLNAVDNNVIGVPADLHQFVAGSAVTSAVVAIWSVSRDLTIPSQSGLTAYAAITGSGIASLNIKHTGSASALSTASVIGTISWGSAQTAGSVNLAASTVIASGTVVIVQASVIPVSTIADFDFTIKARTS